MQVYRYELENGTLQQLIFRAEGNEDLNALKTAVKTWVLANYPGVGWEEFYDRLLVLEAGRITVDMT